MSSLIERLDMIQLLTGIVVGGAYGPELQTGTVLAPLEHVRFEHSGPSQDAAEGIVRLVAGVLIDLVV